MSTVEAEVSAHSIITAMPKAELHCHLDGCLRGRTVVELADREGVDLPVPSERIDQVLIAPPTCGDLMEVLSYFDLPLQVLQTADALERVTYELCEDLAAENVRYAEIRFGPSLHRRNGLSLHEIIEAVVRGWEQGRRAFGLTGGIILSALRQLPQEETQRVAEAGIPFLGAGVVGFDLAGDEARYSVLLHRDALLWAAGAGYGMTVHAGEAAGAESVRDAVEQIGVSRIGHGVRSEQDSSLLPVLRERRITLEMCPISNVHTCAVASLGRHPAARYHRAGIRVTLNTDNRTVSDTTLTRELAAGLNSIGLSLPELAAMTLEALDAGFAERTQRDALRQEFHAQMELLGVSPIV